MEVSEIIKEITGLDFLNTLHEATREQIAGVFADVSDVLQYEDGEAMINAGYLSFASGLVLVKGQATLEWDDRDPIEITAPVLLGEMAQFKTVDLRSATVRAKGTAVGAQFYWEDLYAGTNDGLPAESLKAFQEAIQLQSWDRFQFKEILTLPLISDLTEDVRVKVRRSNFHRRTLLLSSSRN